MSPKWNTPFHIFSLKVHLNRGRNLIQGNITKLVREGFVININRLISIWIFVKAGKIKKEKKAIIFVCNIPYIFRNKMSVSVQLVQSDWKLSHRNILSSPCIIFSTRKGYYPSKSIFKVCTAKCIENRIQGRGGHQQKPKDLIRNLVHVGLCCLLCAS